MATQTPNYSLNLPTVGGDTDLWGGLLNQNWTDIDDLLSGTGIVDGVHIDNAELHALNAVLDICTMLAGSIITDAASVFGASVSLNAEVDEGIQALAGSTPTIDPGTGGPIGDWNPDSGANTPAIVLASGEYYTLNIHLTTGTVNWSGVTWLNGTPALVSNKTNVVELFNIANITYGVFAGATT